MGPYYLTSLVLLMGPVKSVSALAKMSFKERTITTKINYGKKIKVEVPTHLSGELEMVNGAVATVSMSFDVWKSNQPLLEIHGTEGSAQRAGSKHLGGEVKLWTPKKGEWQKHSADPQRQDRPRHRPGRPRLFRANRQARAPHERRAGAAHR